MGKLNGKAALVTGATSGIGRAVSRLFAREGASVLVNGRNAERGLELVEEIRARGARAEFAAGDVSDPGVNQRLVEACKDRFGGLDIAVANAGELGLGALAELEIEAWKKTLSVNLDAVFYLLRWALPEMQRRGGGSIIVNGSIAAFKAFPRHAAYCASKGALLSLVRQVAIDYGPSIRINLLCPGPVDTPLIRESAAAFPDPSRALAEASRRTVMKRLGHPDDIARAALFLACSDSEWITGTALTVDGGIMTGI